MTAMADVAVDEVVAFTQQLVRIRSVFDPTAGSDERRAAEAVVAKMREFGWDPVVTEVSPGRPNVIVVVDGGGGPGPTLAFEGHLDVVTEGHPAEWTVDPFGGEIRDGRLYGRGSADMKAGVAAMLYAVRALQLAGPFPGRIKLLTLVDEEGMMTGAKHAAASGELDGVDGVVVCEPEAGEVCVCAKGALRLRIDVRGKMAHGAMPQHGRNPMPVAAAMVAWCADYQERLQKQLGTHPYLGDVYVTPTVVDGGTLEQMNVIPAAATVAMDIRTVPGVDHDTIVADARVAAAGLASEAGVEVEVGVVDDRPSVEIPEDHPLVVALAAAHQQVTGHPAVFGGVPGSTDGTVITRDTGVGTVVYGPGGKWIAHQADEYVEVDDILQATAVFTETARRFLTQGG